MGVSVPDEVGHDDPNPTPTVDLPVTGTEIPRDTLGSFEGTVLPTSLWGSVTSSLRLS